MSFWETLQEEIKKTFYSNREAKIRLGDREKYSQSTPVDVVQNDRDGIITDVSTTYSISGAVDFLIQDRNNLVKQWKAASYLPEVDDAIQEIINDAIVFEETGDMPITLDLEDVELSDNIKEKIQEAFDKILRLIDFKNNGQELFHQWYVDGTLNLEVVYNNKSFKEGIKKILLLPPFDFFKFLNIKNGEVKYFYNNRATSELRKKLTITQLYTDYKPEIIYEPEQITQAVSGIYSMDKLFPISYLNKAMKVINQVSLIEDAIVIYRITRAPEKKVFYIDTGRMPKAKAEEYLKKMRDKHRQSLVYNSETGTIDNRRKTQAILEEYWLPRNSEGKGTQIDVIQGTGQNLGEIQDLDYFYNKMYRALGVPPSRRSRETRSVHISMNQMDIERDEIKFHKFVLKLRNKFQIMFIDLLKKELLSTELITLRDWEVIKSFIKFIWNNVNDYAEKKFLQNLEDRFAIATSALAFVEQGLLSREYIRKEILKQTDEDIKKMDKTIETEREKHKKDNPESEEGSSPFGK